MKFKSLLAVFIIAFFSCQAKSKQPNIVYILADDMGYGDVQCLNPEGKIPTPNLDAMAQNGVSFTDAHTTSAVCTPTRYSILTGRYNWRTSLKSSVLGGFSKSLIKQETVTVAEMLKEQGYQTAYIGKWHLGWDWTMKANADEKNPNSLGKIKDVDYTAPITNGPSSHGFDYSFGFCGSLDMPPYVWVENDYPTQVPKQLTASVDSKTFWRSGPTSDDFVHAEVLQKVTDKTIAYIKKAKQEKEPFFVYMPLPAPHTPILPTTQFLGKSNTNLYGDFVMQVDDVLGQVRKALSALDLDENTILIFTSDNGCSPRADFEELAKVKHDPSSGFRGSKADIYEGGHHVPFLVEWPAKALKNAKVDHAISTADLFATCADLTHHKMTDNEGVDSYSFLSVLTDSEGEYDREYLVMHSINGSFSIRKGDWKMSFCPGSGGWSDPKPATFKKRTDDYAKFQLYNLAQDPKETNNLFGQETEVETELKAAMQEILSNGRSTDGRKQAYDNPQNWWQIKAFMN